MNLNLAAQLLVSGLVLGASFAVMSFGVSLIYATTDVFHLAHGAVYALAAYGAVIAASAGVPWPVAMLIGVAVGSIAGALCEFGVYRPIRNRGASTLTVFIASLGLSITIPALLQVFFGGENRPLHDFAPTVYNVGPVSFSIVDVAIVVTSAVVISVVLILRQRTRLGLAMTAVQNNPVMASAVGIDPERTYVVVFLLGSALAGVASMLFLTKGTATPNMGLQPVLIGFIGVFLGGVGSHSGAAIGGLTVGILTSMTGLWVTQDFANAILYGFVYLLLIVRPTGLFSRRVG